MSLSFPQIDEPPRTAAVCGLGDPRFADRYRAIDAREVRFDGQFYTAVRSTRIYCRPSCPARTPLPENVTFYLTSAAAQDAGYRACKRCLPEASPGSPEWNLRSDLAGRAMRLILDGVVDREGVPGLAAQLGYTSRHVNRLLTAELGAAPLALARARRAQSARALLVGSDLPLVQVAFASGFGSLRQFNETVRTVFDTQPGALRARLGTRPSRNFTAPRPETTGTTEGGAPLTLSLSLPTRQPYDAPGMFAFLAARAVDGVEHVELSHERQLRYARALMLPHGPAAFEVTARVRAGQDWEIHVALELSDLSDVAPAVARVRRLLDLDADPEAIDLALSADPALAHLVMSTPGIRVPGAVDAHELVVRALIGQQISVRAARTHLSRLAARLGSPYTSRFFGITTVFPSPAQIAAGVPEADPESTLDPYRPLRLPRSATNAIISTCQALASGELRVDLGADPNLLRSALLARPRIGPWTASYIAMRVLGDPDAWLDGDVALRAGARSIGILSDSEGKTAGFRQLADRAQQWAPWRSYAAMHLWQAATAKVAQRAVSPRKLPVSHQKETP